MVRSRTGRSIWPWRSPSTDTGTYSGSGPVTAVRAPSTDKIAKALKPVYTAPTEDAAAERFLEFAEAWGRKYPTIVKLWENAWAEFVPFLAFDVETRKVICSTNAIESVNRPHPQGRPHPWALPERGRSTQVRLHGVDEPRPHRHRPPALDHALESTPERLPDRLRRPAHPGQPLTTSTTKISR